MSWQSAEAATVTTEREQIFITPRFCVEKSLWFIIQFPQVLIIKKFTHYLDKIGE